MKTKIVGLLVAGSALLGAAEDQAARGQQPLTEAEFLMQLDKEGRLKYRTLAPEGKRLALELANRSAISNPKEAVELAEKERAQRQLDNQSRMLHNGMDRIKRND